MRYGIGLDIGVASVGFATIILDESDNPYKLGLLGARVFDAAEHPKDGSSLALPRRLSRTMRRRIRRKSHRKDRIRKLFVDEQLLTTEQLDGLYDFKLPDIYELRTHALDQAVSAEEFARILLHLSQRRGFKSNRKSDAADKESGLLLSAISENTALMNSKAYRTVGEMMFKDELFKEHKRNKASNYMATVSRDMIEAEVHALFEAQRGFNSVFAAKDFEDKYCDILLSQRPFDLGPGKNSPYAGDQILKNWGKCTFEQSEIRAAKACYSFEYFNLLCKINHIRILYNGNSEKLSDSQRSTIISLAHSTPDLNFAKLRKALISMPNDARFNDVRYNNNDVETCEKSTKLAFLKAYHEIRHAYDKIHKGYISIVPRQKLNDIGMALTLFKSDEKIAKYLSEKDFDKTEIEVLLSLRGFTKSGHLSVKVCDLLIPFLEKGMNYNEACNAAGFNFKAHRQGDKSVLISLKDAQQEAENTITSPVVKRAMSQTFKVVNALIREYGESPVYINIENARELSKQLNERRAIEKEYESNRATNERILAEIKDEYKRTNATGLDIVKLKLFREQGEVCVYSQKQLDITRLFEPGYVDIDHIIPYSISFDDSYNNKVLVLSEENRQKGNRLPLEYLKGERRDKYIVWVKNAIHNYKKLQKLLKENLSEEETKAFKQRNLTDTQTVSRFVTNYLADNLLFTAYNSEKKLHVHSIKGAMTSLLRKRWGFSKIRADGDTHHALDAVVIATATQSMINGISSYSYRQETKYMHSESTAYEILTKTGEIKAEFPQPWHNFRKEVIARFSQTPAELLQAKGFNTYTQEELRDLRPIFVSRAPSKKVTGAAHEDTIRSLKCEEGKVVTKTALTSLKLAKNGEIENYVRPNDDRLLYDALKARLQMFGGDGKEAFADCEKNPFHKPKADGTDGPVVKKVKTFKTSSLNVPVHNKTAAADNETMVRIDVFYVEGKGYYFVPIYVADTIKDKLPNKAATKGKNYDNWVDMDKNNFIFSLSKNDLIYVECKTPINFNIANKDSTLEPIIQKSKFFAYYNSADRDSCRISFSNHDNSYKARTGIKTLLKLEKYTVDILGNILKCKKEKRMPFNKRR